MSPRDPRDAEPAAGESEAFLARWSRRKAQARVEPRETDTAPTPPAVTTAVPTPAATIAPAVSAQDPSAAPTPAPAAAHPASPAVELPDIDLLGEDSDYSAFLTPGVDADLRKRALRKLFSSPKFNVFDGLDTYRDDYTQFPALGGIVTADMRYHVERLARKVVEVIDGQTAPVVAPAAPPTVIAATATEPAPSTEASPAEPPATPDPEEPHDGPA